MVRHASYEDYTRVFGSTDVPLGVDLVEEQMALLKDASMVGVGVNHEEGGMKLMAVQQPSEVLKEQVRCSTPLILLFEASKLPWSDSILILLLAVRRVVKEESTHAQGRFREIEGTARAEGPYP